MNKLLEWTAGAAKKLLPAAAKLAKPALRAGAKLMGVLGKKAGALLRSHKTKQLLRKGRRCLRVTALASGGVLLLSCAGLLLSHRR